MQTSQGKKITAKLYSVQYYCYLFFVFDTFINSLQHPCSFTLLLGTFFLSGFPVMFCFGLQNRNTLSYS